MKNFDISKFRKGITKSIDGVSFGFHDPSTWISTGNYALNYYISGDFRKGIPLGKVTMFAGEPASGKSFICSGTVIRHAQEQGILPILIDSENALDEDWLRPLGVDTAEDKLVKMSTATVDGVAKIVSEFVKQYREEYTDVEDRPKILFVIDSLGMLLTPTDIDQFQKGNMKGDMGRKAKQLKAFIQNCVITLADLDIGMVMTNHTYASQDIFDPEDKISGGAGMIFASSIVVAMKKTKLKEDEEGKKVSDVQGINATCKIMKTRFTKPFQVTKIKIPYATGMDEYSGLVELFEKREWLIKRGNRLVHEPDTINEIALYRREWGSNKDGMLMHLVEKMENENVVSENQE